MLLAQPAVRGAGRRHDGGSQSFAFSFPSSQVKTDREPTAELLMSILWQGQISNLKNSFYVLYCCKTFSILFIS